MVKTEVYAAGSPMGLSLFAKDVPKRLAVAGPRSSLITAWAEQIYPNELAVAFSMDQRGAMAYSICELDSSKNRAPERPTCLFGE